MIRLFIYVIVFALVVIGAPQYAPIARFLDSFQQVPSATVMMIDIFALIMGGTLFYLLTRRPSGWLYTYPGVSVQLTHKFLLGLLIAIVFDVLQLFAGYAISLDMLILLPIAFMAGEAVYQILCALLRVYSGASPNPADRQPPDYDLPDYELPEPIGPENFQMESLEPDQPQDEEETSLPRLAVTLPIYAGLIIFLPRTDIYRQLIAGFITLPPMLSLILAGAALCIGLVLGVIIELYFEKQAENLLDPNPKSVSLLIIQRKLGRTFAVGLIISALIVLVSYGLGQLIGLDILLLMPLGFVLAEAVYQILVWRLKYGPASAR